MATSTIKLNETAENFVAASVESGRYADASAVMNAALRLLEREESAYDAKMTALRSAIAEGDASEDAEGDVFADVFAYIHELAGKQDETLAKA